MSVRTRRVGHEIRRMISDLLLKGELHDPRFAGMITFTHVDVSPDLRMAKVYFSCFGSDEERSKTLEAFESANGFIQSEVGSQLTLRVTPKLKFVLDDSMAYGDKIERLIKNIEDE